MKNHRLTKMTIIAILLTGFSIAQAVTADEKSLGRQAEQEGKFRKALIHYVEALKADESNQNLREKIIVLAQKLDPPPTIPKEAKRHKARGRAAFESATSPEDFADADQEYSMAVYYAPWIAEIYFDLGITRNKAGKYGDAIWALNMYLQAKPNADDAEKIEDLIYQIEYRQEKVGRIKAEENKYPKHEDLIGQWTYYAFNLQRTVSRELKLQGDYIVFPQVVSSEANWKLKLQGFELRGTVRINKHALVSESCFFSDQDYFMSTIFQDVIVNGRVSKDMNHITLNFARPWIDKNNNCGVSYKNREVEFIRY